jgi:predicted helicase
LPFYLFNSQNIVLREEYNQFPKIVDIMPNYSLGCLTKRDKLVIGITHKKLEKQILDFIDPKQSDQEAVDKFSLKLKDQDMWNASEARKSVEISNFDQYIKTESFRPFDKRYIFYHPKFVARLNTRIMYNLENPNIAFVFVRQLASLPFDHIWITDSLTDQHNISVRTKEGGVVSPLYIYPTDNPTLFEPPPTSAPGGRRPNLDEKFTQEIAQKLNLEFIPDGKGDQSQTFGPEDIFNYIYAVFHWEHPTFS